MNRSTTGRTTPHRRGHGALILVVLIALGIILYLMFGNMGGTSYMQQVGQTQKQGRAAVESLNTRQLSMLIIMYRDQHGRLPESPADLDNDAAFRDRWGGPITFTFEKAPSGQTVVVYHSNGPDGERGTEHDIEQRDTLAY